MIVGVADAALRDGMLAQPMTPLRSAGKVAAAALPDAKLLARSDVDGLLTTGQ